MLLNVKNVSEGPYVTSFISISGSSFMAFPAPTSSTNVALIGITKALLTLLYGLITYCFFSCVYINSPTTFSKCLGRTV